MVAGGEHCQLRAAIEVLVPYSLQRIEILVPYRQIEAQVSRKFGLGAATPSVGAPIVASDRWL